MESEIQPADMWSFLKALSSVNLSAVKGASQSTAEKQHIACLQYFLRLVKFPHGK